MLQGGEGSYFIETGRTTAVTKNRSHKRLRCYLVDTRTSFLPRRPTASLNSHLKPLGSFTSHIFGWFPQMRDPGTYTTPGRSLQTQRHEGKNSCRGSAVPYTIITLLLYYSILYRSRQRRVKPKTAIDYCESANNINLRYESEIYETGTHE